MSEKILDNTTLAAEQNAGASAKFEEEVTREAIAAAQRAVMLEDGCGLTIKGERTFCDDPRAIEPTTDCMCKRAGRAAALAASQSRPTKEAAPSVPEGWQLVPKEIARDSDLANSFADAIHEGAWHPLDILQRKWDVMLASTSSPAPSPDNGYYNGIQAAANRLNRFLQNHGTSMPSSLANELLLIAEMLPPPPAQGEKT